MRPVIVHDDAKEETRKALEHYEQVRPELASAFRRTLGAAIERVRENPQFYAENEAGERLCMLGRFPYTLVYIELDDSIWVTAVAHQRRRPRYWRHRRPDGP